MIKTGIVISILPSKVGVMTSSGEFVYIKANKVLPKIGEFHTGKLYSKNFYHYKYAITAALLMFVFIPSAYAHSYYMPITTIVLSINPSVSLEANRWDKIISSKALNSDGLIILNNIVIKNKSIDDGLELLLKEAQIENFINDKYVTDKKIISVNIKSNKDHTIDISKFKKIIDRDNLKINIIGSSDNNKKIDIIADNEKVNTTDFDPNDHKKETTNKKSINKSKSLEKPSLGTNKTVIEDKSPEINKEIKKITKPNVIKEEEIDKDAKLENKKSYDYDDENDNKKLKNQSDSNINPRKNNNSSDKSEKDSDD